MQKVFSDAQDVAESKTGIRCYKLTAFTDKTFETVLSLIKTNQDLIAELEELAQVSPRNVTKNQLRMALEIVEYYGKFSYRTSGICQEFVWTKNLSIFEIILDLLSALQASEMIHVRVDNSRNATFQFLSAAFTVETINENEISPLQEDKKHFGTLFVTESSDLQSASDILAESFSDNTSPWRIRNLLVQENIEENFMELLQSKLQKYHPIFVNSQDFQDNFRSALSTASKMHLKICNNPDDAGEVKPTIVLGQNRSYFDLPGSDIAPIVVMNIFRTVKEGIGMVNASNGGSVSIWCEKLSIAYEIASSVKVPSVWINSLAKFTPEIPFSFVFGGLTYGSEIAVLEKMLFQKRYGRNNAISPDDLKTFCNYPSTSLIVGGKYHFECLMSALQNAHLEESNLIKLGSDDIKNRFREILSSCTRVKCQNLASVYTQRKTIVFTFGETFAN